MNEEKKRRELPVNLVWISEGEEENGSEGFQQVIKNNLNWIGKIDACICMNTYWIDDTRPCLVYGMRGVIDLQVEITCGNDPTGYHSGVHGGAIAEPFHDLLAIISNLVDSEGKILIPGFYKNVKDNLETEEKYLHKINLDSENYKAAVSNANLRSNKGFDLLAKRWLQPVLSITEIFTCAQENSTLGSTFRIIPAKASANISVRFVPDQNPLDIANLLSKYVKERFKKLNSKNKLKFEIVHIGDSWVTSVDTALCHAAEKAIKYAWGFNPLYVREGGTMPVIRFLQDILNVPTIQLPIGQASDAAHLPNERIRIHNIYKGIEVLQRLLEFFPEELKCDL